MSYGMIVLAGGIGERMGHPVPKQFLLLGGKPLLIHVLEKVRGLDEIERVVITCPEKHLEATAELLANHRFGSRFECVVGGATRQESVYVGLRALEGVDSVILHEAVRPLATAKEFRDLLTTPDENAIYGHRFVHRAQATIMSRSSWSARAGERPAPTEVQRRRCWRRTRRPVGWARVHEDASLLLTTPRSPSDPAGLDDEHQGHASGRHRHSEAIYADLLGRGI